MSNSFYLSIYSLECEFDEPLPVTVPNGPAEAMPPPELGQAIKAAYTGLGPGGAGFEEACRVLVEQMFAQPPA